MLKALIKSALAANLANVTFAQELLSQMEREKLETGFKARNEHLYVHLMPHSHDDVGWLKTVDEYFTGSSQDIQQGNVRNIIDTVVIELKNDKNKRYTQVEMKYFSMWWDMQTDHKKDDVRQLVKEGRLEFVNAGWSMHDEGSTHYDDMINNMMIGHEFIEREFGDYAKPRCGWHIDDFGHSATNPRLFAEMGLEAWFFARLDFQDKANREANQTMQWIQKSFSKSLGDNVEIFSHTMPDHYHQPSAFRYDERSMDTDPVVIDKNFSDFNGDEKAEIMREYVLQDSLQFATNRLLIPWGDDFYFSNAHLTYESLDNIITYFNEKYDDITLLQSTPSEYVDAIKALDFDWPVRYDDMMPLADNLDDYWTGYFTSRAQAKKLDRQTSSYLHASNKMFAGRMLQPEANDIDEQDIAAKKYQLFDAMGIMQHHDAITGTENQAVADSYNALLQDSLVSSGKLYAQLVGDHAGQDLGMWTACNLDVNAPTDCGITTDMTANWTLAAHNPSAIDQEYIRLQAPATGAFKVYAADAEQKWQVVPADMLCYAATADDYDAMTYTACELFVKASVPAQGLAYLKVESVDPQDADAASYSAPTDTDADWIKSAQYDIQYQGQDDQDRAIFRISDNQIVGHSTQVSFGVQYYLPYVESGNDSSGAYDFKLGKDMSKHVFSKFQKMETYRTKQLGIQCFTGYYRDDDTKEMYTFMLRVLPDVPDALEWEIQLHGIPISDGFGKEVVGTWDFDGLQGGSQTFWTDSNGLEMQKRVLNYREDFDFTTNQPVAANYYPIQSALVMRNSDGMQVTMTNDRSQGCSTIDDSKMEIMINRRLLGHDSGGMTEPLNEMNASGEGIQVNTHFRMQIFDHSKTESLQRHMQRLQDEPIQLFVTSGSVETAPKTLSIEIPDFEGELKIHVFPQGRNDLLVRIENLADLFDKTPETTPMFDLRTYAMNLYSANNAGSSDTDIKVTERNLSNNQDYSDMIAAKFEWKTRDGPSSVVYPADQEADAVVALQPQRIRVFRVQYQPKSDNQALFLQE